MQLPNEELRQPEQQQPGAPARELREPREWRPPPGEAWPAACAPHPTEKPSPSPLPRPDEHVDQRVLLLAPDERAAGEYCESLAGKADAPCVVCRDVDTLCAEIERGAGAVLLVEEAIDAPAAERLARVLSSQPPWSDLGLLVLTDSAGRVSRDSLRAIANLRPQANLTLLERPLRTLTLISAVQSALRGRRRQYQVRDLLRDRDRAVRQRDQFLAMLGHELRNPLGTVQNAAEVLNHMLDRCGPQDPIAGEQRDVIARQVRHLARLVDDLLDVSRITSGKVQLKTKPVDLESLVRRCVRDAEPLARAENHEIAFTPLLAAGAPGPTVIGDPDRLEQVVNNLLTNAVKYTPKGGRVDVTLSVEPNDVGGGEVAVAVADNGVGMSGDVLGNVFDLFTQGDRPLDRTQGGLGIGLTLVKSLVEMHGGRVGAASAGPGRGSEFVVRLPLAVGQRPTPDAPPAAPGPAPSRRVLIVEDNKDARLVMRRLLKLWGHQVETADDGAHGVEAALAVRPEVAIVDIGLPGLDGYVVARKLRDAFGDQIYLIALTGYGQPEDRARAQSAGFDAHLVKPVDLQQLARLLAASR
jgi:signal transduction histidine kinase